MDEWIKKCGGYIQWNTILLKKREILQYLTTQMNLEDIMLSEISQSQEDKSCTPSP